MQQQKDESKIVELLPQVKGKLLDDHKAEISEQRVENSKVSKRKIMYFS